MRNLTEATMRGELSFKTSFLKRVGILRNIPVSEGNKLVSEINLNSQIVKFIKDNSDRRYVVTGNLDIWIRGLMNKIRMNNHFYCSKADVVDDKISKIVSVVDKELTVKQFVQPLVVIRDGDVLVNPSDFKWFMDCEEECIGCIIPSSSEPVYIDVFDGMAKAFSKEKRDMEWCCIAKIDSSRMVKSDKYVYEMIEPLLPLKASIKGEINGYSRRLR